MQKIKYIIVDDEPLAHDVILTYAESIDELELVGQCYSALEALNFLNSKKVDLIFLDIEMPKLKGIDLIATLPYQPKVIITTAYEEYALKGYELNITDYLLKPFSLQRFLIAVKKVKSISEKRPSSEVITTESNSNDSIFIKSDNTVHQIKLKDIHFIESIGGYVKIHCKNTVIVSNKSLQYFDEMLEDSEFIRIHKSYIVSIPHIKKISGNQVVISEVKIPIGRHYKLDLQNRLNLF